MSSFVLPSFSKDTPNKIGNGIDVSGKNTLIMKGKYWRTAIADEPIDAKSDGKKTFCVRVDNAGAGSFIVIGFTPMETFDSKKSARFGDNFFDGCGIFLNNGDLYYPVDNPSTIKSPKKQKRSSSFSRSAATDRRRRFASFVMDKNRNILIFLKY